MSKLYDISAGQLGTIWIFGLLAEWYAITYTGDNFQPTPLSLFLSWLIPFAIIFYSIGWHNARKHIK